MQKHTTTQGQMWDQISLARYGSEKQMAELLPPNVDEMDALFLGGEVQLAVPEMPVQRVRNLPPWERM